MLKINALKIDIETEIGRFGLEEEFCDKLNFIASSINTQGKSTCLEAIYYCLGLEELLGGQNEKALKPVLRKELIYQKKLINVLQSDIYLEIQNGNGTHVTIRRSVKNASRSNKLLTVYYSKIKDFNCKNVKSEDLYIHDSGAATSDIGFHKFLEEFIGWKLPLVPTYEGIDRKLYLQTIFSAFFVEQKRGWADIMATLPTKFGIKDVHKRVIEYIIGLDVLENEKKKLDCNILNKRIKQQWEESVRNVKNHLFSYNCTVHNLPLTPEILKDDFAESLFIIKLVSEGDGITLQEYINRCKEEIEKLENSAEIKIGPKVYDLELELSYKSQELEELEAQLQDERKKQLIEKENITILRDRLSLIKEDLKNNKDVLKLKNMGSMQEWKINKNICPTCNQKIHDCLLPQDENFNLMTIEENIRYLEAQKDMIEFSLENQQSIVNNIDHNILNIETKLHSVQKLIRSIKADLQANENNVSETCIRKKLYYESEIEKTEKLITYINLYTSKLSELSGKWKQLQADLAELPTDYFSEFDKKKLNTLRDYFRTNIGEFGYRSINPFDIDISKDKYMPTIEGFDMKFDSSASDSIRAIWAYTVSLYQTAHKFGGQHSGVIIIDEPGQHSIVVENMKELLNKILTLDGAPQIFIGITLDDKSVIDNLINEDYHILQIDEWAIKPV